MGTQNQNEVFLSGLWPKMIWSLLKPWRFNPKSWLIKLRRSQASWNPRAQAHSKGHHEFLPGSSASGGFKQGNTDLHNRVFFDIHVPKRLTFCHFFNGQFLHQTTKSFKSLFFISHVVVMSHLDMWLTEEYKDLNAHLWFIFAGLPVSLLDVLLIYL